MSRGLLHIYTGNGKGKTTAALGLCMRAAGHGWKILVVQFMKGRLYGELNTAKNIPGFDIEQHGRDEFVDKNNPEKIDLDFARQGLDRAKQALASGEYDLIVLDEINVALDFNLVPLDEVLEAIYTRPERTEVVCTGRYAPAALLEQADLITEMKEVRHPFQKNIQGRKGIEF